MTTFDPRVIVLATLFACAVACDRAPPQEAPAQPREVEVVATVNGAPIREADVALKLRDVHRGAAPAQDSTGALETLIRQELAAQRAAALGLDREPRYRERLRAMEADLAAFRRRELSEALYRKLAADAPVSDEEARRYFDENAPRIRSEVHVWQILRRDERAIRQIAEDLRQGKPFEQAFGSLPARLPPGARAPWDLGYLSFAQVPDAWRDVVYGLEKGQVSEVIAGPNNRYWIVKLVDRRENPDVTFEASKPIVLQALKTHAFERGRTRIDEDLRKGAQVVYGKPSK